MALEANILLRIQNPSTSKESYSEAVSLLSTGTWEHQSTLLHSLFDHVSRDQFSSNFSSFSNLFESLEKSKIENLPTLVEWIETAVRVGYRSEAIPRLRALVESLHKLPHAAQIASSEPIISLCLDLGYEPMARSIYLDLLKLRPQDSELRVILKDEIEQIRVDYLSLVPGLIVDFHLEKLD